jgi:hypothetical protein
LDKRCACISLDREQEQPVDDARSTSEMAIQSQGRSRGVHVAQHEGTHQRREQHRGKSPKQAGPR